MKGQDYYLPTIIILLQVLSLLGQEWRLPICQAHRFFILKIFTKIVMFKFAASFQVKP